MSGLTKLIRSSEKHAKLLGASIFLQDEAGFTLAPNWGRTYDHRRYLHVVQTTGQRQKLSAISAVKARGVFWSKVFTCMLRATWVVEFYRDLRLGERGRVFLVIDGHSGHHAKIVNRRMEGTRGMLELHLIPPYAPDLNPDMFLWQQAKTNGVSKKLLKNKEPHKRRVKATWRRSNQNQNS